LRQYSDIVLFHAVGRADLGLGTEEEFAQLETEFCELLRGQDPDTVSSILRLTRREQTAGDRAPLQSVLATLAKRGDLDGARVRLVLVSTLHVAHFAEAIKESLLIVPDLYGQSFEEIRIARSASLEEQDFTSAVRQTLSDVDTTSAQALAV